MLLSLVASFNGRLPTLAAFKVKKAGCAQWLSLGGVLISLTRMGVDHGGGLVPQNLERGDANANCPPPPDFVI